MNKPVRLMIFSVLIAALGSGSPAVFAKEKGPQGETPPGFSQGQKKGWEGENTPPGWSEGKKKGWDDESTPPGLSKKEKKGKKEKAKHGKAHA